MHAGRRGARVWCCVVLYVSCLWFLQYLLRGLHPPLDSFHEQGCYTFAVG